MTKEQGRKGPLPTSVHIALLGDAGYTKGIAYPFFATNDAAWTESQPDERAVSAPGY
jgi:hypothetical protein